MARGVFTSVTTNDILADVAVDGETTEINIGSAEAGLNASGSVSVQFTCDGSVQLTTYVRSDETVPWVLIGADQFSQIPDTGTFSEGDHIVQISLPVCSWLKTVFTGSGAVSNIRTNVQ